MELLDACSKLEKTCQHGFPEVQIGQRKCAKKIIWHKSHKPLGCQLLASSIVGRRSSEVADHIGQLWRLMVNDSVMYSKWRSEIWRKFVSERNTVQTYHKSVFLSLKPKHTSRESRLFISCTDMQCSSFFFLLRSCSLVRSFFATGVLDGDHSCRLHVVVCSWLSKFLESASWFNGYEEFCLFFKNVFKH